MKRARALFRLQTVEMEIAQKSRRLKEVEFLWGKDDSIAAAQTAVHQAEARLHAAQVESRKLELESQSLQEEAAANEKQLYSGRVTNPKELASLQDKVKNLKERRSKVEDRLLDLMLEIEEAEANLAACRQSLSQLQAEWESDQSGLAAERDALAQSLSALRSERETLRASISAGDLEVFEDLSRRKGGRGVVKMIDGTCQGCGVSVPFNQAKAAAETDELIFCGNCERILCV